MQCTKCQTDSAHRSHRVGLRERVASLAGYYPYRCPKCGTRFQALRNKEAEAAAPATRTLEREISTTQGARRRKAWRRGLVLYGLALILFGVLLYYLTREPSMGG
jgi:hypothetical protein